jgi:hypothetical protein
MAAILVRYKAIVADIQVRIPKDELDKGVFEAKYLGGVPTDNVRGSIVIVVVSFRLLGCRLLLHLKSCCDLLH